MTTSNFLDWLDAKVNYCPMHIYIGYSHMSDWIMHIYKQGCAEDGGDLTIFEGNESDLSLLLAKAEVAVKEWLLENENGY